MSDTLELARGWLQRCLKLHQEAVVRQGYSELTSARHAGEAAVLLGFLELAEAFSEISEMELPGAVIPDERMWKALTTVRPREEVVVSFPLIDDAYLADCDQYPDDDFDAAFRNARTDYDRECVLLTRAIRGQIPEALKACEEFT